MTSHRGLSDMDRSALLPGVLGHCGGSFFRHLAVFEVQGR